MINVEKVESFTNTKILSRNICRRMRIVNLKHFAAFVANSGGGLLIIKNEEIQRADCDEVNFSDKTSLLIVPDSTFPLAIKISDGSILTGEVLNILDLDKKIVRSKCFEMDVLYETCKFYTMLSDFQKNGALKYIADCYSNLYYEFVEEYCEEENESIFSEDSSEEDRLLIVDFYIYHRMIEDGYSIRFMSYGAIECEPTYSLGDDKFYYLQPAGQGLYISLSPDNRFDYVCNVDAVAWDKPRCIQLYLDLLKYLSEFIQATIIENGFEED